MSNTSNIGVAAVVIAAIVAGTLWWRSQQTAEPVTAAAPAAPAPAPAAAAPEPAVKYPVEAEAAAPLAAREVPAALLALLGRKAVSSFIQTDEFPRRFVATLDNLGRPHAPPIVWPVTPTAGRFTVDNGDGGPVIALDNSARYTPFVLMVEAVDTGAAVELYKRMYPLLQQAYVELGFPRKYFNDRVVEVIDLLLAAPDLREPPKLHLTEVKGSVPSDRPWVRYEFAEPALEALPAGQKIMLRVGPVNERRLKAKLKQVRQQLTKAPPQR